MLFLEGRIDEALSLSCRAIDTWRRFEQSADSLLLRLIANAYAIKQHGHQLAELAPEQSLPATCANALAAPEPAELSLCNAMRGEFEIARDAERFVLSTAGNGPSGWLRALGFDPEATRGLIAENRAHQCSEAALERIRPDRAEAPEEKPAPWRFACLGNRVGCRLEAASGPAYAAYSTRMLDFGFQLRALATLAWLHQVHPAEAVTEAMLQSRPAALKSPTRELILLDDGRALGMPLYSDQAAAPWRLPLRAID